MVAVISTERETQPEGGTANMLFVVRISLPKFSGKGVRVN